MRHALLVAALSLLAPVAAAEPTVELFSLPGHSGFTIPWAVNPRGDIVGTAGAQGAGAAFAFVRDRHGGFTTFSVPGGRCTSGRGITPAGDAVVGFYQTISCGGGPELRQGAHGFLRHADGTIEPVDVQLPGATATLALGINGDGDIVGGWRTPDGASHGFLRHEGVDVSVDVPGASFTTCRSISERGDIVGRYDDAAGIMHGYLLRADGTLETLDFPGADGTIAGALNPRGDVVGRYFVGVVDPTIHGFLRVAGSDVVSIDVDGSVLTDPTGISPSGVVVGRTDIVVDGATRTFGFIRTP